MNVVLRPVRMLWRRLTSMRTALILLFLLAVAAVPGSLLPQRPLNPDKTKSYIADHGSWGSFLNSIGMFDVFGSVWFAAIYLLLFVSLVGCLIPRIRVHLRALMRRPLPAPRNLNRLPESGRFETAAGADYVASARSVLGRRWRVEQRTEGSGAITLSAEKGYSRETGNLVFHVALLIALVLIAIGRLYQYEGNVIVKQGSGFCNTPAIYDEWSPGRLAAEGKVGVAPFCVTDMTRFTADYTAAGEPSEFKADIAYQDDPNSPVKRTSVTVNHPLRLEDDRIYLEGHGFAPTITLKMPGRAAITDTEAFLPTNGATLLSDGVFSEPGPSGADQDIGVKGIFAPNAYDQTTGGEVTAKSAIASRSADTTNPVLSMFIYKGDLNQTGLPHSVYTIDTTKMKQIDQVNLRPGQTIKLAGGGTLTFDSWTPWVNFQVSHDPTQGYLLFAALAMVIGLFGSLAVRRRRLWIRISPTLADGAGSPTVVTVGGLARSDSGNFTQEFAGLLERLSSAAAPADGAYRSTLQITHDEPPGDDLPPDSTTPAGSDQDPTDADQLDAIGDDSIVAGRDGRRGRY
jgi:cytochrome c biogenesis protein